MLHSKYYTADVAQQILHSINHTVDTTQQTLQYTPYMSCFCMSIFVIITVTHFTVIMSHASHVALLSPTPTHTQDIAIAFRGADFDWDGQRTCEHSQHNTPPPHANTMVAQINSTTNEQDSTLHQTTSHTVNPAPYRKGPSPRKGPTLRGIQLQVVRGELVAVVGAVGSGKSSLLACLLGELQAGCWDDVRGTLGPARPSTGPVIDRGVAYCAQVCICRWGDIASPTSMYTHVTLYKLMLL